MSDQSNSFIWIMVLTIIAAVVNGAGIFIIFKYRSWAEKAKTYFMCFAAGVLISTPMMLAMPQAMQKNFYTGFVVGVLIYISASHLLPEARGEEKKHSSLAFLSGVGLAIFIVLSKLL